MGLRRRNVESGSEVNTDLNPQLVLSEGQLAANGFSILCSTSLSYRWSRWQALLMDDPLQHNDIIHAAAFADLLRNLIQGEAYQIFMSSHDRTESEFIERKCTAAGIPCTICELTGDSADGVRFDVRYNSAASRLNTDSGPAVARA